MELLENEYKNKIGQWEKHEKLMDNEVAYFARALQDSLKEKTELNEQMNHFKICLKRSLDEFQRLVLDV